MYKKRKWVYDDKPELPGWYAIMYCWDVREGIFVGADHYDGGAWREGLPVTGFAGRFPNKVLAEEWGERHDPEGIT